MKTFTKLLVSALLLLTLTGCLMTSPWTGITYNVEIVSIPVTEDINVEVDYGED